MARKYDAVIRTLLDAHGRTFARAAGIHPEKGTPSELFKLYVVAHLLSARIRHEIAIDASRALFKAKLTTPRKMCEAGWERRTKILNEAGYARYDESTSRMLGENAALLDERWGGDLRRLREEAERDPDQERALLKELKGIGDVGADIFFREVQVAWDECFPFLDEKVLKAAGELGLPRTPAKLAALVDHDDVPRLVAALVRAQIGNDLDEIKTAAAEGREARL